MRRCEHCGVEIEEELAYCPLCRESLEPTADTSDTARAATHPAESISQVNAKRWLWEILSLFALAGAAVVFTTDFAYGMAVSWSRYPLVSIGFLWLSATIVIVLRRHGFLLLLCETAALILFLFLLDLFTLGRPWFLMLALPVTLLASILLGATAAFARKLRLPLHFALAIGMVSIGVFLLALETILNQYLKDLPFVSWSLVAFGCILPLALLVFYFQSRLKGHHFGTRKILHW